MLSKLLFLTAQTVDYWFATYGGTGYTISPRDLYVAADDSIYVCGNYDGPPISGQPVQNGFLLKYTATGSVSWQKTIGTGNIFTENNAAHSVVVGDDSNVYISGFATNNSLVQSYTSAGNLRWQRTLNSGTLGGDRFNAIGKDGSNNVYASGSGAGSIQLTLAKYNSSGAIQFQLHLAAGANAAEGIACDSNGNCYITGASSDSNQTPIFVKYNSTGTLQWQRRLDILTSSFTGNKVAITSDAVYFVTTRSDAELLKYNLNGDLLWQRQLSTISGISGVDTDVFGNVYVCSSNYIAKYDSTGSLQWQRQIVNATSFTAIKHFKRTVYVVGRSGNNLFVAKVPDNGGLTGTYGTFTYQSSSLTSSAGAATSSIGTYTSSTTSSTDAAGTVPLGSLTLTSTKVDI
jgi:hypothetical protein